MKRVFFQSHRLGIVLAATLTTSLLAVRQGVAQEKEPDGAVPPLQVISGKPHERGLQYGSLYRKEIKAFLDREIYQAFVKQPNPREEMLRYAEACAEKIREFCPIVYEEMQGMAEGSGLELKELVLMSLHEELYHKGALPRVPHCTAVAVGPPDTADGNTYVGQTWDWMQSVYGMSRIVHWKRPEGPSVLAYGFPGLWAGAGLNSEGLALCWTSADLGKQETTARVGIPSYALIAHLLYQNSLEDVVREVKRCPAAGWFTFVMTDGKGNLLNIEASPKALAIEHHKARLARVLFGSRKMTGTPEGAEPPLHPRCVKMYGLIAGASGKITGDRLQEFFQDPKCGISVGKGTIDMMVFNTTTREAFLSRGPSYKVEWKRFRFDPK
jgi:hypothetical protein